MHAVAVLLFVLGAGAGAPLRYAVDTYVQTRHDGTLPLGTLTVNAAGSAILGVVAALGAADVLGEPTRLALGTAFCGALTTFSTFAFETVRLVEVGALGAALGTVALNLSVTIVLAGTAYAATLALT
jgi:CrcB protein